MQTSAGRSGGRTTATAVFTDRGGGATSLSPDLCANDRTSGTLTCRAPIPFAPGDTYQLLYGGAETPYGPVVHDMTFNYDVFDPLTRGTGWYPPLSGLYDAATYLTAGACALQRSAAARVSAPLLNDYGLLGPSNLSLYGVPPQPQSQATVAPAAARRDGCARARSFTVAPARPWWSEGETYRALPRIHFALGARWTRTQTQITRIRAIGARAPMIFELDCAGPRCPLATVRGRYDRLGPFERAVQRRPFSAGDVLNLFVGTTHGCGPNCEWGTETLNLRIRSNRVPTLTGCTIAEGVHFAFGRSCTQSGPPHRPRRKLGRRA